MTHRTKLRLPEHLTPPVLLLDDAVARLRRTHKIYCALYGLKCFILADLGPEYALCRGTKVIVSQPSLDACALEWRRHGAPPILARAWRDAKWGPSREPIDIK